MCSMKCSAKMYCTLSYGSFFVTSSTRSTPGYFWLSMFTHPGRICGPQPRWSLVIGVGAGALGYWALVDGCDPAPQCASASAPRFSVPSEMRALRYGIADGGCGDDRRHLLSVKQFDDRLADRRLVIVLREPAAELAHVGDGSLQTLVRPHDPDVVPHRVLNRRPVLQDQRGILHVLMTGWLPIGDRFEKRIVDDAGARRPRRARAAHGWRIGCSCGASNADRRRFHRRRTGLQFRENRGRGVVAPRQSFEQ